MSILYKPICFTTAHWLTLVVVIFTFSNPAPTAWAAPRAQPADKADFAAIDAYLTAPMAELRIPGLALGIVHGPQVVHLKGFGRAAPTGRAVTPQTPFMLNSISKWFGFPVPFTRWYAHATLPSGDLISTAEDMTPICLPNSMVD